MEEFEGVSAFLLLALCKSVSSSRVPTVSQAHLEVSPLSADFSGAQSIDVLLDCHLRAIRGDVSESRSLDGRVSSDLVPRGVARHMVYDRSSGAKEIVHVWLHRNG